MSYDVYVNVRYDDDVIRTLVDLADSVNFFGDGETAQYSAAQFAAHNARYRGTPAHEYEGEEGHGFVLIINRTGRSAALHEAGPGDFDHARDTIRDLTTWLRTHVKQGRAERASIASSQGYADYAYVGALGGWQVTDAGDGRTPTTAAL